MAKKRYTEEELNRPLEPKGILSKAKSIGLSGLAYAGNLLGTPGAVVKNALGGANPLTPLLHPLSGEGRVEGRDLLRQHGLIGNKNTWGNWAGGLAVDIALDPLTYASPLGAMTKLGALTKAGRAAHAIGALDDVTNAATAIGRSAGTLGAKQVMGRAAARARTSLDDLLNFGDEATKTSRRAALAEYAAKNNLRVNDLLGEKLGGVMNIGLPGTHGYTIGASEAGAKFMEGLGGAAAAIPGAGLAGKVAGGAKHIVKGLFHGPSGGRIFTPTGKLDRYGQELSEKAHKYMGPAKHATVQQSLNFWDRFKAVDEEFHKAYRPEEAIAAGSKKYPLANGDLVKAGDRGNYGYVMSVADDGAEVHFTNPSTGATATVKMPYEQLKRASSTELPESLRAMHDPVSRVLDRMVHMTGETQGNVDAAIEKFAKGQHIPPALRESIQKLAADAIEAKDAVWKTRIEMGGKGGMLDKGEEMLPPAEPAQPPPPPPPPPLDHPAVDVPAGTLPGSTDDLSKLFGIDLETLAPAGVSKRPQSGGPNVSSVASTAGYESLPIHSTGAIQGWKLHLSTKRPEEVSKILQSLGIRHKVGRSGQDGKDITAYIGHRDLAQKVADLINKKAGQLLDDPYGEVLKDDISFGGKVMGRFDISGPNSEFHQYGSEGIPHLNQHMDPYNPVPKEVARKAAIEALTKKYGPAFTGSHGDIMPSVAAPPPGGQPVPVTLYRGFQGGLEGGKHLGGSAAERVAGQAPVGFQHSPRYSTPRGTGEPLKEFRQTPTGHASAGGRVPILRGLRKDQANDLGKLEKYRTPDAAKHILEDMGDNLGYKNAEGIDVSKAEHAQELAEYAARLPKDWVEKGKNIFDNMSFQDLGHYLLSAHKGNASLKALHESFMMNLGEEGVPLQEAFKFAGMDQNRALVYASQHYGLSPEQLLNARIPPELANAARSVIMTYENAEWSNLITKTLDTVNRYFKPAMVLVKPAFWFRNHTSGQYANLVSGYIENPGDFGKYWSAYKEAHDLWKSGDKAFERELQVLGVLGIDSTLEAHQHILKGTTQGPHAPLPPNPLRVGETSKEVWQGMSANPMPGQPVLDLLAKGTSGIRHKASTWMETNAKFNKLVEYQNRASLYLYLKRKGFTPEQASKIVTEVHYDYSSGAMAPFERDVMRRIVPFYVFSRNNLPWTVERLLTSPGGTMGQTIQALGRAHKTEDLSPEYLSETASVPLKTLPDGSRRYLTGLGLGFEDPAGFFTPSVKQVGLEALSRTSPLIKAPLEYAFGQSAFQKGPYGGRSLEDLNPPLGQTISNIGQLAGLRDKQGPVKLPGGELFEHVLSNSPLAGVLTSARTLTDPRKNAAAKAINLLSGLHVTDVSPASQDAELLRRAGRVERQLLGARSYSGTFVPKDRQAEFTPKEQEMAAELKALRRLLEERKKQRK